MLYDQCYDCKQIGVGAIALLPISIGRGVAVLTIANQVVTLYLEL